MGTEIVYLVIARDRTLASTLATVSRILRTGRRVRGLTLSIAAGSLKKLVKAHGLIRRHTDALQPISWQHEYPHIALPQAKRHAQRVLAWALAAPAPATAIVRLRCRLRNGPGHRQTIGYLQNDNWPGTLQLPSVGPGETPRDEGARVLGALGFHHLAVAYPSIHVQSTQGMEIRSGADQAALKFLGISGEHPTSLLVTPFRREQAVVLFRRLLREHVERAFSGAIEVGGYPAAARQAYRARLIPFRDGAFTAEGVQRMTPGLLRRINTLSDHFDAVWLVNRRPTAAIRSFDVHLFKIREEGYSIEISSKDFWQEEKVEQLARSWQVELAYLGER